MKGLLPGLRSAIQEAAAEVRRLFLSRGFSVTEKAPGDFLTTADLRSNEILQAALMEMLPEAAWISEESTQSLKRRSHSLAWIVDPIDGTKEFVSGIPEFSISVGLVRDGLPVLGAVALPAENLLVYGGIDEGLLVDDGLESRRTDLRSGRELADADLLVSSTEYSRGVFDKFAPGLHIIPTGSVARKLALVAAGRADANLSLYPKNEWDICGGCALIQATGGRTVHYLLDSKEWVPHRFNGESLLSYGLIAGPSPLVEALIERQTAEGWTIFRQYGA